MFWYIIGGTLLYVLYKLVTGRFADYRSKYTNKVVVIVGASSGIGEELALQVSQFKPELVLVSRRVEKLEAIKEKCRGLGANSVTIIPADVSKEEDCKRLVEETIKVHGKINVLFLNAGIGLTSSLYKMEKTGPGPLKEVFDVDLFGAIYPAFYALPHLRKNAGHIVVTSSAYGKIPGVGISAYVSAKHALHGFFDCLRAEEIRNRIRVTMVCPGYIKTPIHDNSLGSDGKPVGTHKKSSLFAFTEVSVKKAAHTILRAAAANKTEVSFPFLVTVGVWVRGIIGPGLFDWLVYGSK
jgi:short-subunit dehydrogenase